MAPTGYVAAELSLDGGAAWGVEVLKDAKGKLSVKFNPRNSFCRAYKLPRYHEVIPE